MIPVPRFCLLRPSPARLGEPALDEREMPEVVRHHAPLRDKDTVSLGGRGIFTEAAAAVLGGGQATRLLTCDDATREPAPGIPARRTMGAD